MGVTEGNSTRRAWRDNFAQSETEPDYVLENVWPETVMRVF
jgi:hypothetical protein